MKLKDFWDVNMFALHTKQREQFFEPFCSFNFKTPLKLWNLCKSFVWISGSECTSNWCHMISVNEASLYCFEPWFDEFRLSSHCRLKWPKSDFFAQMWPISDFLMTVWTAQIRPRPLSYVFLNRIHIPCFAMRLQSERPCRMRFLHHWNATDVTILRWRRRED